MSAGETLLPCPCGARCDGEPYEIAKALWRMDCEEADCGWAVIAPSRAQALIDWNRRATRIERLSAAATGGEVVGFRWRRNGSKWQAVLDRAPDSFELRECEIESLYATPPPSPDAAVREAWHDIYDENAVMPELNQEVLVFVPGEGVRFDVWREWREQPAGPLVGGWVTFGPDFTENDGVTHWMPLPAPPRALAGGASS